MKLSHITETRYASPPKNAAEAFDKYERFFIEKKSERRFNSVTFVEHDYAEIDAANYASIYLWVDLADSDEDATQKVREAFRHFNLPYTDISVARDYGSRYHATVYFKEDLE